MLEKENFIEKYGPWALIIGGSSGMGLAFAENCAKRGLNVAITSHRSDELDVAEALLRERYGVETRQVVADISQENCAEIIKSELNDLEIGFYIFVAAISPGGPFVRIKEEEHLKNIIGNCVTPTKLTHWIAREMAKRHRGGIYIVSSMAALGGIANWVSYGAGKGYELLLAEGLWYELKDYGVNVAGYVVGATETPTFKSTQQKHGTGITSESNQKDPKSILPRTPEAVATNLFEQLEDGPRLFSHPDDKKVAEQMAMMSRKDYVNAMSANTTANFLGGMNNLLDPIE